MRRPAWLDRESDAWVRERLISAEQRSAILARYSPPVERGAASILMWLAALAGGVGFVLLVGWNWDRIPRAVQLGGTFATTALLFLGALVARGRESAIVADRLVFLASIAAAGIFVAVDDGYHAATPGVSVFWAITTCVTAALVPGLFVTLLASGVTAVWLLAQGGAQPPPWTFLLLGPLLALAVEQVPSRLASGAVSTVFVVWVWGIAIDTWTDAFAPAMGFALLAAATLDAWAHAPAGRRPAFARATPAAFFLVVALFFLQPWHQMARAHPFDDVLASPWPALALAAALAAAAIWPAIRRRPDSARAAVLALVGAGFLGAWILAPDAVAGAAARWPWLLAFGAAAVFCGVSLVREAAREGDLGLFAMGVLSVVSFVAARAIGSEGNLWQSSLSLFAGALILWWLGRTWAKRSPRSGEARE